MSEHAPITAIDEWVIGEDQVIEWDIYQRNRRTLQDITGWSLEFRMARSKGGASILTLAASIVNATSGRCRVQVGSADTLGLAPRTNWYELWRTNAGAAARIAHGEAALLAAVEA